MVQQRFRTILLIVHEHVVLRYDSANSGDVYTCFSRLLLLFGLLRSTIVTVSLRLGVDGELSASV
jgi:hypothetical protein